MLARSYYTLVWVGRITLKALNQGLDIGGEVISVLSRCLLTTAPARVPERVDVLFTDQPTARQVDQENQQESRSLGQCGLRC
jgi:hypothetical protein